MATIEKRKSRGQIVYYVKVRRKGSPAQSATLPSLRAAREWAARTEVAILESRHLPMAEAKRHTVSEAIDRYTVEVLPHKKPSTIYNQRYHLERWRGEVGHLTLADVTPAIIIEHRDKLAQNRSGSTVNKHLAILGHIFTIAVKDWQWLRDNPVHRVRKPRESRGRVRFLNAEERERLLAECRASRSTNLYPLVILALSTGARRGELLNLCWRDIDLTSGTIYLDMTKNGERRSLPLTGHALELMRQHPRGESQFVFPNPTGKQPADVREAWARAVKRAGLVDFRFHDLRHTAASYLAMGGASLMEIATILGHKSLTVTQRYSHLSQEHTRSVVARMNEAIFRS